MTVNLLFTIDVDNDGSQRDARAPLAWESIGAIPAIKELFEAHRASLTWFVRADNQLSEVYGSASFLLQEHATLWSDLEHSGDELAWHPHLYEQTGSEKTWVAALDPDGCVNKIQTIHAELERDGFRFASVRIGEAFHCNATMRAVDALGLSVDSTAIPGVTRCDKSRVFDWGTTPNRPYHPSQDDYRIPGAVGRTILEVPMTSVPIRAAYDGRPVARYVNPTFHHEIFRALVTRYLAEEASENRFLVTVLHPDEVVPQTSSHALYSYSLETVRQNVVFLLESLDTRGLEHRTLRMKDVPDSSHAR